MKSFINNFIKSTTFKVTLHIIGWSAILLLPFIFPYLEGFSSNPVLESMFFRNLFRISLMIIFFYLNAEFLIPHFLFKRKLSKYWAYTSLIILVIFVANGLFSTYVDHPGMIGQRINASEEVSSYPGIQNAPPDSFNRDFRMQPPPRFTESKEFNRIFFFRGWIVPTFFSVLLTFAISTSLKITSEWVKNENLRKDMETEKLQSELSFLKSQVNPHFLFNTLNNIYYLAYKKSDDTTTAVSKLSQLMRYMLYESDVNKINLQKEIEYLENYIDLQKIRSADNLQINLVKEGHIETYYIEPMLLIPFVENAFKHGISNLEDCKIDISVSVLDEKLTLTVKNKIFTNKSVITNDKGIGLQNVKQRLKLLYPGKHFLELKDLDNYYYVTLKLELAK